MAKFDQQSYMDITFASDSESLKISGTTSKEITKVNFVDEFEKREESDDEEDEE